VAKSRAAVNVEYWTLKCLCALVNVLPYRVAMSVARGIAWTMCRVFRFRRRRTFERIRSVFPGISDADASSIALGSLANLLMNVVEMMRAPSLDRKWMDAHVKDGLDYKNQLQAYVDEGRGVVIMVPHSGNWYMAAWSMAKYGLPLFSIAARQRNPRITEWMNRQYGDIEVFDRDSRSSLVRIREKLAAGGVFAILPDLRVWDRDVETDFLGGKANVSHAGAMFAVKCGSPVIVAIMSREGGRHVFTHLGTIRPDASAPDQREEARRITREAMKLLDAAIRRRPHEWFWYNKRWILEPPAE